MIDAAAIEAEPLQKKVATVDLTQSPSPAPPAGAGVPTAAGRHAVDLSTSDCSSTDEHPEEDFLVADPAVPAAVAAIAAAKRAKNGMAGDITEGREDVQKMQGLD